MTATHVAVFVVLYLLVILPQFRRINSLPPAVAAWIFGAITVLLAVLLLILAREPVHLGRHCEFFILGCTP